jgi:hypothetical protein
VLLGSTSAAAASAAADGRRNRMLDLVYLLGVLAGFALIGAAARGVAKL